jgi:hypothetical protein
MYCSTKKEAGLAKQSVVNVSQVFTVGKRSAGRTHHSAASGRREEPL